MSEQRIIEAMGEQELLPELMRDRHGDALIPVTEVEQMFAVVRQQLTELTAALRRDLEELRRLVSDTPPTRGPSELSASSDDPRRKAALPWRHHERDADDASRQVIDPRAGIEVERKFIVKELPPELDRFPSERISQGYLAIGEGGLEVRLRRRGENTTLTVKKGLGRTRREEEIGLGPEQFQRLWPLTEGRRVEKVRHLIPAEDGLTIELDSYMEELDGLATAEVEFDSEARADGFDPPQWFGPEVTDDPRYRNARLACNGAPPPPRRAPEPFMLDQQETATEGIRRIVCGQIDAAIDDLGAGVLEDPGEAVHACRKRFKRVRADRATGARRARHRRLSAGERCVPRLSVDASRAHATARCWLKPWTRSASATPSSSPPGRLPAYVRRWLTSMRRPSNSCARMLRPERPSSPSCAPRARGSQRGASGTTRCPRSHPVSSASTAAAAALTSSRARNPPTRTSMSYVSAPRTSGMPPRF